MGNKINSIIIFLFYLISLKGIFIETVNSQSKKSTGIFCDHDKICEDCILCGNNTFSFNYEKCSFDNLFCNKSIILNFNLISKYISFFREDSEINEFCGDGYISTNSFIDSLVIADTSKYINNRSLKKKINCGYIISKSKIYEDKEENPLTLSLEISELNKNINDYERFNLNYNILLYDTREKNILYTGKDSELRQSKLIINVNDWPYIIILIDILKNNISSDIKEYLKISLKTNHKISKVIIINIICFTTIPLTIIIILIIWIKYKRSRGNRNEIPRQQELIRKREEKKRKYLFEVTLAGKEFSSENVINNCTECLICLEKFQDKILVCITPCKHIFHYECLHKLSDWKIEEQLNLKCPLCKFDLIEYNDKQFEIFEKKQKEKIEEEGKKESQSRNSIQNITKVHVNSKNNGSQSEENMRNHKEN